VVHEAWLQTLQRERRQRAIWLSAAAAVIFAILAGWQFSSRVGSPTPIIAATLVRTSGHLAIEGRANVKHAGASTNSVSSIYVGEDIDTGDDVALLSLADNANIRLAAHTRLRWRATGEIVLASGKVYVDSGMHSVPLLIDTAFGSVSHLGTRYQVSRNADDLKVSVRDGKIEIKTTQGLMQVQARQSIKVDSRSVVTRKDINPYGSEWDWADNLSPRFEIDNRTLAEFLEWVAHETGHTVKYSDEATRAAATQTILHIHGMTESLAPMSTLSMVLPTTDFGVSYAEDQLIVQRR
jgi:ferric-dicitrate binding protein FerR (iron transport regulator)